MSVETFSKPLCTTALERLFSTTNSLHEKLGHCRLFRIIPQTLLATGYGFVGSIAVVETIASTIFYLFDHNWRCSALCSFNTLGFCVVSLLSRNFPTEKTTQLLYQNALLVHSVPDAAKQEVITKCITELLFQVQTNRVDFQYTAIDLSRFYNKLKLGQKKIDFFDTVCQVLHTLLTKSQRVEQKKFKEFEWQTPRAAKEREYAKHIRSIVKKTLHNATFGANPWIQNIPDGFEQLTSFDADIIMPVANLVQLNEIKTKPKCPQKFKERQKRLLEAHALFKKLPEKERALLEKTVLGHGDASCFKKDTNIKKLFHLITALSLELHQGILLQSTYSYKSKSITVNEFSKAWQLVVEKMESEKKATEILSTIFALK